MIRLIFLEAEKSIIFFVIDFVSSMCIEIDTSEFLAVSSNFERAVFAKN